jgi:hypothetical protein
MGLEVRTTDTGSIAWDFRLSINSAEVYNCTQTTNRTKHHTLGPGVRVASPFPNFP